MTSLGLIKNLETLQPKSPTFAAGKSLQNSSASSKSSDDFASVFSQSKKNQTSAGSTGQQPKPDEGVPKEIPDALPPSPTMKEDVTRRMESPALAGLPERQMNVPVAGAGPGLEGRVEVKEELVDSLEQRQALQNLLKRMQDELGIDAEQIVQAFASLSSEELELPPELTLDKIIQALPLNPEQQILAKAMFQEMLKQTANESMANYLTGSKRQLSLEVLSQNQAKQRAMNRAVEQMQAQFFVQGQQPTRPAQPSADLAQSRYQAQQALAPQMSDLSAVSEPEIGQESPKVSARSEGALAIPVGFKLQQGQPVPSQVQNVHPPEGGAQAPDLAQLQKNQQTLAEAARGKDQQQLGAQLATDPNLATVDIEQPSFGLTAPADAAPTAVPVSAIGGLVGLGLSASSEDSSEQSDSQGTPEFDGSAQLAAMDKLHQPSASGKVEGFVVNTQPTQAEQAANIKEIVQQAQLLSRQGGGEMKIALSPEGLGQIAMKVSVQGGQVNVEMIAETSDAKKILEKGLGDLKATLLSHNLRVDQIKVETPADVSRQLTQQQDDAQRQFAQQFMEQFRQQNSEWRRGFYDIPGARSSRSQREEAERSPGQVTASQRRSSERRLDLVA